MTKSELAVGDSIEVKTERLAYGGEAIARHQGLAIFVQGGAPDETLRVRIVERKKSFARAIIETIIMPSPARREPPCKYFGECGGCQLQHIDYGTQLSEKVGFIRDALRRTGQIDWTDEIKMHSSKEFHYRLRAKLKIEPVFENRLPDKFAKQKPKAIHIGFRHARSHQVCDIDHCEILLPELNEGLEKIREEFGKRQDWRGNRSDEIELADFQEFSKNPETPNSETAPSDAIIQAVYPDKLIQYKIAGTIYQFSSSTFFQANALLLDDFVTEAVGDEKGALAIDLYAGVGLFTIPLARNFKQVIGVESNPHSVAFASRNISINAIENAGVVCDRTESWLNTYLHQSEAQSPDLILLDPPRSGAAEAIEAIIKLNPRRIHYVSCDPLTLARDLQKLVAGNYRIERIVAFDMFPQTYHVESMAFLVRR